MIILFVLLVISLGVVAELVISNLFEKAANFARIAVIYVLVMFSLVFMPNESQAQIPSPQKVELIKTFGQDTVDVSNLNVNGNTVDVNVSFSDNVTNIQIIEEVEFLNCQNKNVQSRLVKAGYFDIVPRGTKHSVSLSDRSEQVVSINNNNLEIKRKYKVICPQDKVVINKKPNKNVQ